jgi:peroxiredoxin Q/BCP
MPTSKKKAIATKSATKTSATKKPVTKKVATKKATVQKATMKKATSAKPVAKKPATKLVEVGAIAPAFALLNEAGKMVSLADFKGKTVVVYFYPKDDTSGCTVEACDFRDNLAQFKKLGCTVFGVSPDSVKSHAKFIAKHTLGALTLLADEPANEGGTPSVCAAYGVWQEKSMYGRAYMGVVRTTYVIAKNGTVANRFDKVSVDGHVGEVVAAVKAIA